MDEPQVIRSRANSLLKRVGSVVAGKDRTTVVLEGDRLIEDAMAAGWQLELVLVDEQRGTLAAKWSEIDCELRLVESRLLGRTSGLETSPGSLALAVMPEQRALEDLQPELAPRVLVVAGLQNPGNLGALARSAEGAGFDHVVVVAGGARPFGSKALRGSMGSLLRVNVHHAESATEAEKHLDRGGYRQVCAATRHGRHWKDFDWSTPLALWVGGEAGLDPQVMENFEAVSIPMAGKVESLNITVAASLLLFAAASKA